LFLLDWRLRVVRFVFTVVVTALLTLGAAYSLAPTKANPSGKSTQKKSSGKASGKTSKSGKASGTGKSSTGSRKKGTATARGKKPAQPPRPRGQQVPAPDRIKEIQQALIQRGYLKGEPSGVWSQDSTDAMRRFQEDQKMEASGKVSSMALIQLGLGPKRDAPAQQRTEQPQ
jgi:hypothetical protein